MIKVIRKFFLICSGATLDLLEREECKTELGRYAMIGAFVVFTAAFACLSGGYALYVGFHNLAVAIVVGILWGAFIFTLDRFIVSTIKKLPSDPDTPLWRKVTNKLSEIATALPRLIMAIMIATTVAVPLEIKYFAPEIEAKLAKDNLEAGVQTATVAEQGIPEIGVLQTELSNMDEQERIKRERRDLLRDQRRKEVEGAAGEGLTGVPGYGREAEKRAAEAQQVEDEFKALTEANASRRQQVRTRLDNLRVLLDNTIQQQGNARTAGDGFLARLRALGQLAEADGLVKSATRFLVVLLILVETAPVVIKLFSPRGPYDDLLEEFEHKVRINKQKEISNFNTDVIKDLAYYDSISEARRQLEEQLTRESMSFDRIQSHAGKEIEDASAEIARARIEHWRWKELQKLAKAH
jgi:hypothetical protein